MDPTAIAAASINLNLNKTEQSVDIAMLRKAMDLQESSCDELIQSMGSLSPYLGHNLDIRV